MIAFYVGRVSGLAALPDILQIVGINSDLQTADKMQGIYETPY
jgi:hypothetical protein